MCISGASGSGKTFLLHCMLTEPNKLGGIFQPNYSKILYFYRFWQPIYNKILASLGNKIKFEKCDAGDFEKFINYAIQVSLSQFSTSFSNKEVEQNMLLVIFDDSCEESFQSRFFVNLCTAGRHQNIHLIFIKHNLYQRGKFSVTIDKNTTHLVLLESPRQGKQLRILGSELDGITANFLEDCYTTSTRKPFGHLLIDLTPNCPDNLRFCTNITNESLSLFKKKVSVKNNSLKINNFFANQLSTDSQTLFFVPKKLRRSSRTKIERTRSHSLIYEKYLSLGNSEPLIAMYNEAAGLL